jgi:two-component system, sensor histidine kinase
LLNKTKPEHLYDDELEYQSAINPDQLEIATVSLAQKQLYNTWVTSLAAPLITFFVFLNVTPLPVLITWTSIVIFMVSLRFLHTCRCPVESNDIDKIRKWKFQLIILQWISAGIWGSMPYVILNDAGIIYLSYITGLLYISSAVILPSFSLVLPAYYGNCILTLTPLSIYLFSLNEQFYSIVAIASLFLMIIFIKYARTMNKSTQETLKLRFENIDLVEQLKAEKEKAEKANTDKSRFLAAASHDLRQPLHSLGLFLGAMDSYTENKKLKDLLDKSNRSLSSLQQLFNSLLDVSKLDAQAVTISRTHFKLNSLIEKMLPDFQRQAEEKGIKLNILCGDQVIYSDFLLLSRCIRNLISNALKYTFEGNVTVDCQLKNDHYYIKINDTGQGIPESEIDNIFNEFHQLDNPERDRQKGLGLGLAIVKRLCNLIDHEYGIESTENIGSSFYIKVPKGDLFKITDEKQESFSEPVQQTSSILVIDDEKDILDAIKLTLEKWNHNVEIASTIDEAISVIKNGFKPDIIMTDYRLQRDKTGLDAVREIKQHITDNTAYIIITGDTSPERIKEASNSGYPIIHKPVTPIVLRNAINQLLSR